MREYKPPEWLTAEIKALLGTRSDRSIARELGVHSDMVNRWRNRLGIPSYEPVEDRIRPFIDQLGKAKDTTIARLTGLNKRTVYRFRVDLGIPRYLVRQVHGTVASYDHGCRCTECTKAKSAKGRAYMRARREKARSTATT